MVARVLCVAEKPSIAKAVANHLGSHVQTRASAGPQWVKNYVFDFDFTQPWGRCNVVMTCVAGHIAQSDFHSQYRGWKSCSPLELFEAPIVKSIAEDKKGIAKNIEKEARGAKYLYIWTDCDREGEHIGTEIRDIALKVNSQLEVKRAKFSNIERGHVIQAAKRPIDLDERQANAVAARMELDLRIGASFTRMQTQNLGPMIASMREGPISYGSCQFPTLGFVVDRYFRVQNFKPETFWKIQVFHERDGIKVTFHWRRVHLFDRMVATILFERCLVARTARVTDLQQKPTSKWRPLPLTTVELQKMGSRFLRMDSKKVMEVAEELYTKGLISYPRTETDQFPRDMDLRAIVEKQTGNGEWGAYAASLLSGGFRTPRAGRNNDQAHPPIHPVNHPDSGLETLDARRVYEFVVRRFLATCSEDARGSSTTLTLSYGPETFSATGLVVLERNYLDVYPYDKWESTQALPEFRIGETFVPKEAKLVDGRTTPPGYLTEPELIALMDANGIGTDATMAEHIAKIKEREYVITQGGTGSNSTAERGSGARGRGWGRGVGGRGGRGGATANAGAGGGGGNAVFIPTTLGVALIAGYDNVGFTTSLSKPFLRKEMELQMKAICAGDATRNDVVQSSLEQYRDVYVKTVQQVEVLRRSFRKYILGEVT